jgi:hypothetical protein
MDDDQNAGQSARINPGYASMQIAKALTTAEEHADLATRQRAMEKAAKWSAMFKSIVDGGIAVGSRTPISGAPIWITLEVLTGGFATGEFLAAGSLQPHEQTLLGQLSAATELANPRHALNVYFLTDAGISRLQELLRSAEYEVGVPEEGALLVVAWLLKHGHNETARDLLEKIGPYISQLRFYPAPRTLPRFSDSRVFVEDVGATIDRLRNIKPNAQILAQKEAIEIWTPLYDRVVALFLESIEKEPANLAAGPPAGWHERAQFLLNEVDDAARRASHSRKHTRPKENFAQLIWFLRKWVDPRRDRDGKEVKRVRELLARYVSKRGEPGSATCRAVRERQSGQCEGPTFHEIARVIVGRLGKFSPQTGLEDIASVVKPVDGAEVQVPPSIVRKVMRCLLEEVDVLIERGVITSAEMLALLLPQITSSVRAAGISDPQLRTLYGEIYRAFRRRRSLLLLDLQSQVKIEELPWVGAIEGFRSESLSTTAVARQTLAELATITVSSFPHTIVPNKVIQEFRALAKGAELDLPLVDELATDIFVGEFSEVFVKAAKVAAGMLQGTLYERYYDIDFREIHQLEISVTGGKSKPADDAFATICAARASVPLGTWRPATNGMIIEQQQILTTQNLAALFQAIDLRGKLQSHVEQLAKRCFMWICRRQQAKPTQFHDTLIMLKNTAYAWRQMIFFLSMLPTADTKPFLDWAELHLAKQPESFARRFRPAMNGLLFAARGERIQSEAPAEARRFLGWSNARHWLAGTC